MFSCCFGVDDWSFWLCLLLAGALRRDSYSMLLELHFLLCLLLVACYLLEHWGGALTQCSLNCDDRHLMMFLPCMAELEWPEFYLSLNPEFAHYIHTNQITNVITNRLIDQLKSIPNFNNDTHSQRPQWIPNDPPLTSSNMNWTWTKNEPHETTLIMNWAWTTCEPLEIQYFNNCQGLRFIVMANISCSSPKISSGYISFTNMEYHNGVLSYLKTQK